MTLDATRFQTVRQATVALSEALSAEDCAAQSMIETSPVKWHLAHTTWFFETFALARHEPRFRPFHDAFAALFGVSADPLADRARRGLLTRPSLDEVYWYRRSVDERMGPLLERVEHDPKLAFVIALGLMHEEQHQEAIVADVLHLFSLSPLKPVLRKGEAKRTIPGRSEWQRFEAGAYTIGADATAFSSDVTFDNERPRHRVWLEPFEIASRLVTVQEYQTFIDDRGYERPELWLADGFDLVRREGWRTPLHWEGEKIFTIHGMVSRDSRDAVRHLSYYEADAYARWAGARLPTEAEWEVAASGGVLDQCFDVAWQWTSSAYGPYPGFAPFPGVFGEYDGKFMANQFVLRGGSQITPPGHVHASHRGARSPHARWQLSGLRLTNDL